MKQFFQKYQEYFYSAFIILIMIFFTVILLSIPLKKKPSLLERVSGKILLQVMDQGQAWYVYPQDQKRYLLSIDGFETVKKLAVKVGGQIDEKSLVGYFITADEKTYYYFNPADFKKYSFSDFAGLLNVIRTVGVGAYNRDLKAIEVGEALDN